MGISQVATLALQFSASVVLARVLSPYEMGIYAVAVATVGLIGLIQAFGLQAIIVREENLTEEFTATVFTLNTLIALIMSTSILGLSVAGGVLLHEQGVRRVMLALALTPLLNAFSFLPASRLERDGRFGELSKAAVAGSIVSAVTTIGFALGGARYMSAAYAGWAGALSTSVVLNIAGREFLKFRLGFWEWRRVADFGFQMFATAGLHSIGARVSDLLLGKFAGLSSLGIYTRSSNLNGLIWNNIHLAAGRVMFVDFAQMHRQGIPLRDKYIATVDVITATLWPAFAGFAIIAAPFISIVYRRRWVLAAQPLALLSIASMIAVTTTMTWEIFAATGKLRLQTRIEFYIAIFSVTAFAFGSRFGIIAAAGSRVMSAIFSSLVYRPHLYRMTSTRLRDFYPVYARSAVLTLLAVGPAAVLMFAHHMSPGVPAVSVLLAVATGLALWLAGLKAFNHRLLGELKVTLRHRSRGATQPFGSSSDPSG